LIIYIKLIYNSFITIISSSNLGFIKAVKSNPILKLFAFYEKYKIGNGSNLSKTVLLYCSLLIYNIYKMQQ